MFTIDINICFRFIGFDPKKEYEKEIHMLSEYYRSDGGKNGDNDVTHDSGKVITGHTMMKSFGRTRAVARRVDTLTSECLQL